MRLTVEQRGPAGICNRFGPRKRESYGREIDAIIIIPHTFARSARRRLSMLTRADIADAVMVFAVMIGVWLMVGL